MRAHICLSCLQRTGIVGNTWWGFDHHIGISGQYTTRSQTANRGILQHQHFTRTSQGELAHLQMLIAPRLNDVYISVAQNLFAAPDPCMSYGLRLCIFCGKPTRLSWERIEPYQQSYDNMVIVPSVTDTSYSNARFKMIVFVVQKLSWSLGKPCRACCTFGQVNFVILRMDEMLPELLHDKTNTVTTTSTRTNRQMHMLDKCINNRNCM